MLTSARTWVPTGDNALIFNYLPDDNSAQTHSMPEAIKILERYEKSEQSLKVLDLGCGIGSSFEKFEKSQKKLSWIGLDIEDSPEVNSRIRNDLQFLTYDGVHIPLPSDSVDLIYSHLCIERKWWTSFSIQYRICDQQSKMAVDTQAGENAQCD